MVHIGRIIAVPAAGAYYVEDLAALRAQDIPLADRYTAQPATPGFRRVREPAEAVSVGVVLEGLPEPKIAWGDCVGVAYGGKAGRDPVFRAAEGLAAIRQVIAPALAGRPLVRFRELAAEVDDLIAAIDVGSLPPDPEARTGQRGLSRRDVVTSPSSLLRSFKEGLEESLAPQTVAPVRANMALRYGVSQALLAAAALARRLTIAELVADEWGLPLPDAPVPIHAQAGSERYHNADKMIVRRVASLPHILIDNIKTQLGRSGANLAQYLRVLSGRIAELGGADYHPTIHIDVHGALGVICQNNLGRVLGQLYTLENAARPYPLRIESPVIMDSREEQIEALKTLRDYVRARGMQTQIVADEWANTLADIRAFIDAGAADMIQIKMPDLGGVQHSIDAVLACRAGGVGAFLGGSCVETDISARISIHIALATRPDMVMARPGMGVDEAVMLAQNEMARTLAWIAARQQPPAAASS